MKTETAKKLLESGLAMADIRSIQRGLNESGIASAMELNAIYKHIAHKLCMVNDADDNENAVLAIALAYADEMVERFDDHVQANLAIATQSAADAMMVGYNSVVTQ